DGGRHWQFLSRINDLGSPCHLLLLDDGRILATYGYRSYPFGIRCSISEDEGNTWKHELIIRDDGGSWDLGYPVSIQLDSGEIVSVYYFNDKNDSIQQDGGVRYIAGSIYKL
ncbi:MAG TPA: sialidase family protein, partial [bacterium]|nr:sialidase family protein [bacterium]